MKIGYRRWSRPIGFTEDETFAVSGWWEKRRAFITMLRARGHQVFNLSALTKESNGRTGDMFDVGGANEQLDLLIIEVSNENVFQNYKHIAKSVEILSAHDGKVIILWDDPELCMRLRTSANCKLPHLNLEKRDYIVFANAEKIEEQGELMIKKLFPDCGWFPYGKVDVEFFPFGAMLEFPESASEPMLNKSIYIGGGSGGRERKLLKLLELTRDIDIFYNQKSYKKLPVTGDAPQQPQRKAKYAQYLCNIGLQDNLHKKFGWHTGRAFHALSAGIPTLVELDSVLAKYFTGGDFLNIDKAIQICPQKRGEWYLRSRGAVMALRPVLNEVLTKYSL